MDVARMVFMVWSPKVGVCERKKMKIAITGDPSIMES